MKQLCLLLFFLLSFPVMAQEKDALLLYTINEDPIHKIYLLNADTGEEKLIVEIENPPDSLWYDLGRRFGENKSTPFAFF